MQNRIRTHGGDQGRVESEMDWRDEILSTPLYCILGFIWQIVETNFCAFVAEWLFIAGHLSCFVGGNWRYYGVIVQKYKNSRSKLDLNGIGIPGTVLISSQEWNSLNYIIDVIVGHIDWQLK